MFSGLSLVLNKEVCDWTRQTLNLSELKGERPAKPDLIHTSCRSESSNISLVVLDKDLVDRFSTRATLLGWIHFWADYSFYFKLVKLNIITIFSWLNMDFLTKLCPNKMDNINEIEIIPKCCQLVDSKIFSPLLDNTRTTYRHTFKDRSSADKARSFSSESDN